jgi:hypothetical protein
VKWLDTPPVTTFDVTSKGRTHLKLEGPTADSRVAGGIISGVGTAFAAMGLRFLRAPLPGPAKLIPLAFTALGASAAALGGAQLLSRCTIMCTRAGITFTWAVRPLKERSLEVAATDIEALEIVAEERTNETEHYTLLHVLMLVKKDGTAIPFESFATRAQANLRKKAIEAVTRV